MNFSKKRRVIKFKKHDVMIKSLKIKHQLGNCFGQCLRLQFMIWGTFLLKFREKTNDILNFDTNIPVIIINVYIGVKFLSLNKLNFEE
ncbi:hypothetical protein BpHYR1_004472 [Brachionus plicatilis]|uniref:Uncharacterized protein n=1 Tax=Brachionus plicatilis TaxID=10195 RepID=A0A3M7S9G8_BRAPC|nr:hypothetical protein BpHYR1_004472 [Brachionus plicatilis]